MEVQNFKLTFAYKGSLQEAHCQKFKVTEYPQIRVAVKRRNGYDDIYIFYEIDDKKKVFWYELTGKKHEISKAIAKQLNENMLEK